MIDKVIKSPFKLVILPALCILFVVCVTNYASGSEYAEESPDTVLPYDDVITGTMDDFSDRLIYVDGIGYRFCDTVKIFNPRNRMIQKENIEAAIDVKVFSNKGCIRKMKVLRYAQ